MDVMEQKEVGGENNVWCIALSLSLSRKIIM